MDYLARLRDIPPPPTSIASSPPQSTTDFPRIHTDPQPESDRSDQTIAFIKGPKRKRLAKACDACHKSKRRCDGTAPCSNCYFASKRCTYTDASGKPVPAPRPFNLDRPENSLDARSDPHPPRSDGAPTGSPSFVAIQPSDTALSTPPSEDDRARNPRAKRLRTSLANTPSGTPPRSFAPPLIRPDRPLERDQTLTRELVHLFFAYRQPQRMIIHQSSFLAALSHGTVPQHLLLAVCAVAAPLSMQPRLRTSPCRYSGDVFAQEAVALMFDKNHQLVCEHNLATAQALVLLQLYNRMGKSLWVGQHHQLALEIVTKLGIFDTDSTVFTPYPSPELIDDCFGWMLYRRARLATDSQTNLRLPIDETSFEISPLTAVPEFMTKPGPSFSMCSESGQLIRILLLREQVEKFVEGLNDCENEGYPVDQLQEIETRVGAWADVLPEYMRFTEDSLWVHVTQYDTASNMGAWCFFVMHVVHCSCILALNLGRQLCHSGNSLDPTWAQDRILKVIDALGKKAKLSIFLGVAIWPLFKYAGDPPNRVWLSWSSEFEEIWGVRIQDLTQRQVPVGPRQLLRTQLAPPPPMPPLPVARTSGTQTRSISPVSWIGSDVSPSLLVQLPNNLPLGRMAHDASTSLSSSHPENRVESEHDALEKEVRSTVDDADIDPILQVTSDTRLQETSHWPVSAPPLSLPSLKASGLLEWPRPGSADGVAGQPSMQSGGSWQQHFVSSRQLQRDAGRGINVQSILDGSRPLAPSASSSMPVGLQWLAHELSAPRPS